MFYLTLIFGKDWQSSVEMDLLWFTNKHAQILVSNNIQIQVFDTRF